MMSKTLDLCFEVVENTVTSATYTNGCSGSRSDCCTRTCTRQDNSLATGQSSLAAWDAYLDINAGVLQY